MELCFGYGAMTAGDVASITAYAGGGCSDAPATGSYAIDDAAYGFAWPKKKKCKGIWYDFNMYGRVNRNLGYAYGPAGKTLWKKCAHLCHNIVLCVAWRSRTYNGVAYCDLLDSICDYDTNKPNRRICGLYQSAGTASGFSTKVTQKLFDQYKNVWMGSDPTTTTTAPTTVATLTGGVTATATTITATTTAPRSYKLCNAGHYLHGNTCEQCLDNTWTPAGNSAVECTPHRKCRKNEYTIIGGLTTHPNVCLIENDDGSCPDGQYRLNVLPRQWITDEYEELQAENLDNVSDHTIGRYTINNESGVANASDAPISNYTECLKSHVFNATYHPACNDIHKFKTKLSLNELNNESYTNIWTEHHSFHLCAEDILSCDADDTKIESAAATTTSGRVCDFCPPIKVGDADPVACPNVTRIHAPLECTFPYRYAASQHNMSSTTNHTRTCCRMEQSGTIVSANNTIIWDQLTDIDWLRWDPEVEPDTKCTTGKTLWSYNKSCDDYQLETVVDDDPPIIEPGYAMVNGTRECTSQYNFSCTYTCSARRCRHHNATVVTECDRAVMPYGKLVVNKTAQSDLVATCKECLRNEYTTASSTTIAGAPATTVAAVSPPTRSPKRRYIYVGLMGTAIIAWCFIFSKHE